VDPKNGTIVPWETAPAGAPIGLYLTGAGQVTPSEATGNVPAGGISPIPNLPVSLTIGGVPVTPDYIAIPSWSIGTLQINFTLPVTMAAGSQQVVVTIGGMASKPALLTVSPAAQH
jgi:uncharacterized protein (TIGR03437 family)